MFDAAAWRRQARYLREMGELDGDEAMGASEPLSPHLPIAALQHSWNWFCHYNEQRLALFRFFLIIYGTMATAFVFGIKTGKAPVLSVVAGSIAIFITVIFFLLDYRSRRSARFGLRVMRRLQKPLAVELRMPEFEMAALQHDTRWRHMPFGPIQALFIAAFVCAIAGFFFSLQFAYKSACDPVPAAPKVAVETAIGCALLHGPLAANACGSAPPQNGESPTTTAQPADGELCRLMKGIYRLNGDTIPALWAYLNQSLWPSPAGDHAVTSAPKPVAKSASADGTKTR